jgi:hypothetical protein
VASIRTCLLQVGTLYGVEKDLFITRSYDTIYGVNKELSATRRCFI